MKIGFRSLIGEAVVMLPPTDAALRIGVLANLVRVRVRSSVFRNESQSRIRTLVMVRVIVRVRVRRILSTFQGSNPVTVCCDWAWVQTRCRQALKVN